MSFRCTKYVCHDGPIESFTIGPRNELVLDIALNPVWNRRGPSSCCLRFGAIKNMDDVTAYFSKVPLTPKHPNGFLAGVLDIVYDGKSRWIIDLVDVGSLTVHSAKYSES